LRKSAPTSCCSTCTCKPTLLQRLRAAGIPVALVTGSADLDDYRGAADALLGKPFEPQTLVETARRLARVDG
jgi:CheY-like chemotaxis protein